MELKPNTMNACWRNIWSEIVKKQNHIQPLTEQEEIVDVVQQLGGEGFEDLR